ncbi:pectinesterase inhibitor 10-like [Bos indicus x Bos taurus]|uniref:pectinesterase inhibitor 10-like n=1 Tax=Bos indicus x Bos taurus TaxID=30522 RepID=UPI000F7D1C9A|nr:pectinesterase inhibitor 10-like [Bos indicus x Bos taurus]
MEAQKWVTPSAGCGEEAEVREDDLGFSWGSLSRGCVRSARAGLPRVSCLPLNPPGSRACGRRPAPPPSSGEPQGTPPPSLVPAPPRSLHRARSFSTVASASGPAAEALAERPPHPLYKPAPGNSLHPPEPG